MKADIENPEKEDVKVSSPRDGVGCVDGFLRDSHYVLSFLSMALLLFPILWFYDIIGTQFFHIAEAILGVVYIIYCFMSHSFQYLRNVVTTEDITMFMRRMYETKPKIEWSIQCYHYETRSRSNANGGIEYYQKKVKTHSATGVLNFVGWEDISTPLKGSDIEDCTMTKVSVKKKWIGDGGAALQKARFISSNDRDKHYDFEETLHLSGYRQRFLGFSNIEDVPCLAHWSWYVLSHLTVVFALPYRMWLSSRTGKVRTEIVKKVWTA